MFKGYNPSENLLKDDQNFTRRDVKKGGSNKKGESAHKYFWNIFLIIFPGLNPREYQWECQKAKSIFSLNVLKDSVNKNLIEKTSEMRVLPLEFLFKLWFEHITRFSFLETNGDEY